MVLVPNLPIISLAPKAYCWRVVGAGLQHYETMTRMQASADDVSCAAGFAFTTGVRASRGFSPC